MRALVILLLLLLIVPGTSWSDYPSQPAGRKVSLRATGNTRDLGGVPAQGGTVRRGKIYRSGALCFLTAQDVEVVKNLRLKTLVELRMPVEITKDGPDRPGLTRHVPNLVHLPMGNSRGLRREAYVSYMAECEELYRDFFALLAREGSYPLLFHCSAGKDRTGILTALLLSHLGTPREIILDDYLQSRRNSPGLVVEPEWIQVVFDQIDKTGGIHDYLTGLGVSQAQLENIRKLLVVQK